MWRDITFLFRGAHSSSILALFFGPTPRYAVEMPCYLAKNESAPAAIFSDRANRERQRYERNFSHKSSRRASQANRRLVIWQRRAMLSER